jgi:hypothetical protein
VGNFNFLRYANNLKSNIGTVNVTNNEITQYREEFTADSLNLLSFSSVTISNLTGKIICIIVPNLSMLDPLKLKSPFCPLSVLRNFALSTYIINCKAIVTKAKTKNETVVIVEVILVQN